VVDKMNKLSKHHVLATDSFYTSFKLCQLNFSCVGSIKKNRLPLAKEEANSSIPKGTYDFFQKGDIFITKYLDKKVFFTISNFIKKYHKRMPKMAK